MNCPAVIENKKQLRQTMRQKCKNIDAVWRSMANEKINNLLIGNVLWAHSNHLGVFWSDGSEPDLSPFCRWAVAENKSVYLPRYNAETGGYDMVKIVDFAAGLTVGRYGILEPKPDLPPASPNELAQITFLVPGVAYDASGNRLGRGKGYYDRLLQNCTQKVTGVFFRFQKLERIPAEAHDRRLDRVVNEDGLEILGK